MKKRKNALLLASMACLSFLAPSCSSNDGDKSDASSSEIQKNYFSISFSSGEGYQISALEGYDSGKVEEGKDFRFKVTPLEGYSVTHVFIDDSGYSLLPDNDGVYLIQNVRSNINVAATASIDLLRIVFSSGKFVMAPLDDKNADKLPYGASFRFRLIPHEHNKIASVSYQGADLEADAEGIYTIASVKASSFVSVTTKEDTYRFVLPKEDGFNIELADASIDLDSVPYSKEVKFKISPSKYHQIDTVRLNGNDLTKGEDGYYSIKNLEGEARLAVTSSIIQCQVTFDTLGASSIATITQDAGTLLAEPSAPSKTMDDYYDSVSFEGWYSSIGKYDFSSPLEGSVDLVAHYAYGEAKKEVVTQFKGDDFTFTNGSKASTSIRGSFNIATYSQYGGNSDALDKLEADFGRTLDDGILIHASDSGESTFTMPTINFQSLLANGNDVYMEAGTFNTHNWASLNGKNVLSNSGDNSVQAPLSLRNVLVRFSLTSAGKVNAYFQNILAETPFSSESNPSAEVLLSDKQASGEEGLTFSLQTGSTRLFWFGNPYIVKATRKVRDFSSLSGYSLENAKGKAAEKLAVQSSSDGMMIECSGASISDQSVLTLDPINFAQYFQNGDGLRFQIGSGNGQEEIVWLNGEKETSFGKSATAPENEKKQTREEMQKTWQNWQFDFSKAGLFVTNMNEGRTHFVPLSYNQLSGIDGVKIRLSNNSESTGKSYILSNITAYKA